jgi:O-antigen ligase
LDSRGTALSAWLRSRKAGTIVAARVGHYPIGRYPASHSDAADLFIRGALFAVVMLGVWTSFNPFSRLDQPIEVTDVGSVTTQAAYSALFVVLAIWCFTHQPLRLVILVRPVLILALAWCALSIVTSWEPSLSARRFAYALVTIGIAGMVMLVPKNLRHFADLMAAVALIIIIASYLGVVLAPANTIHQASDMLEPELAGDWRGIFGHKNGASAAMVVFVFAGLMVSKVRSRSLGMTIIVLALPFLWFTHSKTAIAELPLVLLISFVVAHVRTPLTGITIAIGVVAGLNILAVGSIYSTSIHTLIETLGLDPTFSGRTDVWKFVIGHIAENPITGHGFSTFWGTEQVVYGMNENGWARTVSTAHSGYLDLALTIGVPGAVLMTLWLVVTPIADYYRAAGVPANDPLRLFFLRVCLFASYESCFESSFLQVGAFLLILIAAGFGLRYMSVTRVVP